MSIDPIIDGEDGASVRGKLNAAISEANSIDAALAGKADASHTHTVPFYWLDFLNYDPTLSSNSSEEVPVVSAVKGYADGKLSKAGGTMTGAIELAADAAGAMQPVTKQQLEAALLNMGKRTRVRVKTTGDVNLGGGLVAGASVDGVTVALGDLVLVASQSTTSQNGVYTVPASGSAARATEFDTWDEHPGSLVTVAEGSTQADTVWLCTSNAGGTLGSTAIAFSQLRVSGELLAANNLSDVANAATARSNLGLVIGTHVQAYSLNLAAFAGLSLVADRLPYANGAGTLALATFTATGRVLAAITEGAAASKLPYFTGSGAAALADVRPRTLHGRTALDLLRRPNVPQRNYVVGATWLSSTSAADNAWISVCWSPELGLFCAVANSGTGNRVMTSPDGITWTSRTSAADNDWRSVCWSAELGLFCAVAESGTGNRVMTSPDGITWTSRTSAADNAWISVCWSPELGLFCAVAYSGTGNRVMTSPDGVNWTIRTSAANNTWRSVCWSAELGLFCAVSSTGTGSRVMTSPDGSAWTIRTSAADNNWFGVCWSPELRLFCAVAYSGTGNRVMTSPDGVTWTIRTSAADNTWTSVCWSPELGVFVAVADTGSGNRVMSSPNGIDWTTRTSAADNSWGSVCWAPDLGLFAAIAYSGSGNRAMTSVSAFKYPYRS